MSNKVQFPISIFYDVDGLPLDGGFIYIGVINQNPITNPLTVYWDEAGTQPVTQPISTVAGYPVNAGVRSSFYVTGPFSILCKNRNGGETIPTQNVPLVVSPVTEGGTGRNTLTQNALLAGNGTSPVNLISPGAAGEILTSTGTSWVSAVLPATGDVYGPASATDSALVAFNGTTGKIIKQASTVTVPQGGTGLATIPANGVVIGNGTAAVTTVSPGTAGQVLTSNGSSALPTWQNAVSLSGNNNLTGANTFYNATGQTFAQASTNDGIIVQGRSGGSSSYRVTFTTATLSSNTTLTLPNVNDTLATIGTAQTFTAKQTFDGSTSVLAAALKNIVEPATVSATAATGTINYDVTTQSVLYYTSNASANWTVNFRASSGTSLNTAMSTGDVVTVAFLVTQGSTAYYNSAVQVDGSSVTPKYQGGTAWTSGNASGIDIYTYTIIKTASATFTVLASQTKFA